MSYDNIDYEKVKEDAEKHYDYLSTLMKKMFIDAFVHGYKHGVIDYEKH